MKYSEQLALARANNIDIFALHIADETGAIFGENHPDYEDLCAVMYELYTNTYHMSCETLGNALRYALEHEDIKLANVRKHSKEFDLVVELACSMD